MSPTAEPANPSAVLGAAELPLQDGELIILSIKPSRWYVLLVSWPVVLAAALVAGGVALSERFGMYTADSGLANWLCAGVAVIRLVWATVQWAALRYVLTSRRLLRIGAGGRAGLTELPLACVQSAEVTRSAGQRALAVGSLAFRGESGKALPMLWAYVAQPDRLAHLINEAIAKAHR